MRFPCLVLDHDDTVVNSTAVIHFPSFLAYLAQVRPGLSYTLDDYFRKNFDLGIIPLFKDELGFTDEELEGEYQFWQNWVATDDESNSGPVEYEDGSLRVCWFYQIDNAPGQLYSVKLDLADFGDGWRLDEVTVWPNVEWKTAEGIGIGSTEDEVRAAYPDAETKDSTLVQDDVEIPRTFFTIGEGRTKLRIMVRDGKVANLNLGTFFEEPPFEVE